MAPAQEAAPPAPAAPAVVAPEAEHAASRDVDDAEAELARAEQALDQAMRTPADAKATTETGRDAPARKEAAQAPSAATRGTASVAGASGCPLACRALDAMRRAGDHVCAIVGSAEARCDAAREHVRAAEARVSAACPACAP